MPPNYLKPDGKGIIELMEDLEKCLDEHVRLCKEGWINRAVERDREKSTGENDPLPKKG